MSVWRGSLLLTSWLQAGVERLKQKLDEANEQNRQEMETALKSMQWQLRTYVCPRHLRAAGCCCTPARSSVALAVTFLVAWHQAAGQVQDGGGRA
jgi:hypothetical protein